MADTTDKEKTESDTEDGDIQLLPSQIELLVKPIPAPRSRRNCPPCMSTPTRETPQPVPRKDRMQRFEQPVVELIPIESSEEGAVEMYPENGGLSSSIVAGSEAQEEEGEPDDVSDDEESREAESFHDIEFQNSNNDVGIENAEVTGASLQDEDLEIEENFDAKSDNDEDDLESSEQRRASTKRIRKPRKLLNYNELGGQPSWGTKALMKVIY